MNFGREIIKWYDKNKRSLPWRDTKDPYFIWLSEIILQQTRIEQGLGYYQRFAEKYPTVKKLAAAKEDHVLKLWQGLGYYSRARNLHFAAKQIANDFKGTFPSDYESIRSLRGVGDYTAAAIASFSFNLKYPVVDGNVFRLLSRYFGIKTPIDTSKGKKEFTKLAGGLMENHSPSDFNQGIMEFGSKQCRPLNPACESCPLNAGCFSFKEKAVSSFPVKKNKTRIRNRYFNYLVVRERNSFYIKKRTGKDIWNGLHDFPLIETKNRIKESDLFSSSEWKEVFRKNKTKLLKVSPEYKHVLSHQNIFAKFYEVSCEAKLLSEPFVSWQKVNSSTLTKYAIPRLIEKYISSD